jgi:hypothetical protein
VAFYVPLGPRGALFRIGTLIISLTGGLSYWWACRRRPVVPLPIPEPLFVTEP